MKLSDAKMLKTILLKKIDGAKTQEDKNAILLEVLQLNAIIADLVGPNKAKASLSTANSAFEEAVAKTFEQEGFWSNSKSDPGGTTMYGISSRYNPEVADKIRSKTLTLEEAKGIYKEKYWNKIYRVDELPSSIAWLIFDSNVHGTKESIEDIQTWLNEHYGADLKVDGIFGPRTFYAIPHNEADIAALLGYLESRSLVSAQKAANRVMEEQARRGLPLLDYSAGFNNRLKSRYQFAYNV